jgi:hypothetical protein
MRSQMATNSDPFCPYGHEVVPPCFPPPLAGAEPLEQE